MQVKRQSTPQRVGPTLQQQQEAATASGLVWPQPHKRHVGRPNKKDLWQNALCKAIGSGTLPTGLISQPPPWCREGLPLLAQATDVEVIEEAKPEAAEGEGKRRRPKIHHDEEVKDWFLDLCVFQKTRFNWNYMQTFHYAQMLCPNIFGSLNHDVPRRWKHSEENEGKSPPTPAGRKKKFPDALLTVIADICHHVTDKIPVSVSVLKPLVDKELSKHGWPGVSRTWLTECLKLLGLTFRKHLVRSSVTFTHEQSVDLQGNV
eukprot:685290-Amphidinium_carterae.1